MRGILTVITCADSPSQQEFLHEFWQEEGEFRSS